MDFDSLKNQVTNLTLYDVKAGFRKAQNMVLNLSEMESKVREATNNEPWGASSSMMQEIANATFNYAQLNEIMPMIYKRFTEKAAEEWRQIYKALQLLEFLIKNGSERVVDDARSHISLLKMLRQFHYIDHNGKDQGINVRNRAKELAELLGDVEKIRAERKKSRTTRNKYRGHEGGAGIGPSAGSSSRYGGFGSESAGGAPNRGYGGYSGGVYGDGGGFGGEGGQEDYGDTQARRDRFEEYDEYDDGGATAPAAARRKAAKPSAAKPEPPKAKEPEVDLFDFGDEPVSTPAAVPAVTSARAGGHAPRSSSLANFAAPAAAPAGGDDDFDDFQSAPASAAPTIAAPQPQGNNAGINNILSTISPPPGAQSIRPAPAATSTAPNYAAFNTVMSPTSSQQQARPQGANYFGSIPAAGAQSTPGSGISTPSISTQATAAKKPASADPFAALAFGSKKTSGAQKGPTMADMAKQKTSAGLWGTPTQGSSSAGSGDLI